MLEQQRYRSARRLATEGGPSLPRGEFVGSGKDPRRAAILTPPTRLRELSDVGQSSCAARATSHLPPPGPDYFRPRPENSFVPMCARLSVLLPPPPSPPGSSLPSTDVAERCFKFLETEALAEAPGCLRKTRAGSLRGLPRVPVTALAASSFRTLLAEIAAPERISEDPHQMVRVSVEEK